MDSEPEIICIDSPSPNTISPSRSRSIKLPAQWKQKKKRQPDSDCEELWDLEDENVPPNNGNMSTSPFKGALITLDDSPKKINGDASGESRRSNCTIHEMSTDEIDSDEYVGSGSNKAVDPLPRDIHYIGNSRDENGREPQPKPGCSKSLLNKNHLPPQKNLVNPKKMKLPYMSDSENDEELPDIDVDMTVPSNDFFPPHIPTSSANSSDVDESNGNYQGSQQSTASSTNSVITATSNFRVTMPKSKSRKNNSMQKETAEDKAAEKAREKELKRLEKERKMEEKKRAQEVRKAAAEVQRSAKPGESIKHMILLLPSSLTKRFESLIPALVASDLKYEEVDEKFVKNAITFKRELMQQAMGDDLQVRLVSNFIEEDQVVVFLDSDELIPMIHVQLGADNDSVLDLISWVESIKSVFLSKKLTLLIYDLDKYYRKLKKNTQQDFRNRVLNDGDVPVPQQPRRKKKPDLPEISSNQVQSSLIEMQLRTGVNYRMIKNSGELSSALFHYTKAIADTPFKKQRLDSQGFDWCAISDSTGSIKVEKDGSGLKKLWIEQLQQFSGVNSDMATKLASKYPSPMKLYEAFAACSTQQEGESLLKDFTATTGSGPLARARKLGPEASKKMYRFFTSTNGRRFLGATLDSR